MTRHDVPDCGLLSNPSSIRRDLFHALHPYGRRLINSWARRGIGAAAKGPRASHFEGFIYLWFALNGWGACVAEADTDRQWVEAVAGDLGLSEMFRELQERDRRFREAASAFAQLWPIFRSSEIRRRQILVPPKHSRRERVGAYFDNNLTGFQPSCWKRHDGQPPVDWAHSLKAIYRVRCNLFHGEKTLDSENDRVIVQASYDILALFLDEGKLLA